MGGASGQQSQSQGSSSGTSNFSSFPQNLQYPQYQAMAPTVETGVSSAINQTGPQGFSTGYNNVSPTTLWNPNLGQIVGAANPNQNPLVAPVSGGQQTQLSGVNQFSPLGQIYNPNTPTAMAQGNAQQLTNFAQGGGNPVLNGTLQGAQNIYGQAPGNFAPGVGYAQQAGGAAGQILPNAQAGLNAATGQALNYDFGTNMANAGANQAGVNNYGTNQAGNAINFANQAQYGAPQANAAAGFAGAGQNLSPVQQALTNEMNPAFAYNTAVNPFTQGVVQAAVNPLIQSFNAQTVPGLQGTFTAAGQRVNAGAGGGVGGSSAFDIAGANALTGLGANIGATAANILNPTYQTGLGIQANAPVQAAGVQGQILQGLESSAAQQQASEQAKTGALQQTAQTQASTQAQQIASLSQAAQTQLQTQTGKTTQELQAAATAGTLTAQESQALTAASQASTAAAGAQAGAQTAATNAATAASQAGTQQLATAATTNQQIATQQLNDTINALNANALPQMTQQYGINQGLSLYNSQVNQLLTAMGLGGQISQPAIGNIASGGGSSSGQNTSSSGGKGFTLF